MRRVGRRRAVLLAGAAILLLAVLGYATGAVAVYDVASRVSPDCGGRYQRFTPADRHADAVSGDWRVPGFDPAPWLVPDWRDARFPSRDPGIELHGWWLPPADLATAPLVVMVHGLDSCVRDPAVLAPAGMLWHAGFGVMLVDLRDHGASDVEDGRFAGGTEEYRDALAALDWAVDQGAGGGGIGLVGISMGAATALIAGAEEPRVAAVWEDSSFADIVTRISDRLAQKGLPTIFAPAGPVVARLIAGDDYDAHTPMDAMADLAGRHVAIVHGAEDQATYVSHAAALAEAAWTHDVVTDVWVIPGAGHVQAMFLDPTGYRDRMIGFFREAFARGA